MSESKLNERGSNGSSDSNGNGELKIYFLPNLLTAGNLFCGFLALTIIVGAPSLYVLESPYTELSVQFDAAKQAIYWALELILLACVFDVLDGRVARLGGYDSPFGREFDSLADVVSFGIVPAFLVHRVVLGDVFQKSPEVGWGIASIFVICGALRLARFNCYAAIEDDRKARGEVAGKHSSEFMGFPIPAAAGMVASITYFLIWFEDKGFTQGDWKFALPVLLLFLSAMMVSKVAYPTFKKVNLRGSRSFFFMVIAAVGIGLVATVGRKYALPIGAPVIFIVYLVYGFVRPWMPNRTRREIEEDVPEGNGG
ncbi:MAG: CDP-alcohol phosphatidyltransferase family protein [Verrucomicrobiota bacterium]|nr:CDP-alcohol phosphatidyltransferase family protein [Verrucomicrobiota bacterium]